MALRLDAKWHAALDLCEALALLGAGPRAASTRALLDRARAEMAG